MGKPSSKLSDGTRSICETSRGRARISDTGTAAHTDDDDDDDDDDDEGDVDLGMLLLSLSLLLLPRHSMCCCSAAPAAWQASPAFASSSQVFSPFLTRGKASCRLL